MQIIFVFRDAMQKLEDVVRHELLGSAVQVIKCTDVTKEGTQGIVVDETQQTLIIHTEEKAMTVPKAQSTFVFSTEHGSVRVTGQLLVGRPAERIRQPVPHRWDL